MFCGPDRTGRDRTGLVQIGPDRTDYSSLYGELVFLVQTPAKPDLLDRIQIGIGNCHLSLRRTRHVLLHAEIHFFETSHLEFMFCSPDRTARDQTGLVQIGPDRTHYSSLYEKPAFFIQTPAKPDLLGRTQIGIGNCHVPLRRTRHLLKT